MKVSKIFSQKHILGGMLATLFLSLFSCGTYQSAYLGDNDGIHSSYNTPNEDIKVVDRKEFDENYFSKELDDLQQIGDDEVFIDIHDYYYDNPNYEEGLEWLLER